MTAGKIDNRGDILTRTQFIEDVSGKTGIPPELFVLEETPEEVLSQARALLKYRETVKQSGRKSPRGMYCAWFTSTQSGADAMDALQGIEDAYRIPAVMEGWYEETIVTEGSKPPTV